MYIVNVYGTLEESMIKMIGMNRAEINFVTKLRTCIPNLYYEHFVISSFECQIEKYFSATFQNNQFNEAQHDGFAFIQCNYWYIDDFVLLSNMAF